MLFQPEQKWHENEFSEVFNSFDGKQENPAEVPTFAKSFAREGSYKGLHAIEAQIRNRGERATWVGR